MKKYLIILMLFFSLAAQSQQIVYTPMTAAGYQIKYLKTDSGFALPFRDTTIGRGVDRPGLMVINPQDSLPYYYSGKFWKPVYVDSTGVIELINNKVDSVTVNGNNLFYWVAGLGYGAQLNKLDSIHVSADSIFTCIAGNCTFQYLTTAGTGTVTSIMAGFGLTGDTITTTGTIAVDTSVFHTSNWNNAAYAPIVHFHSASDIISGTLPIVRGGTGLSGIGGAGQSLRVATSGSALEYYTPPQSRFGIEDNTGVQDRGINMQQNSLQLDSINNFHVYNNNDGGFLDFAFGDGYNYTNRTTEIYADNRNINLFAQGNNGGENNVYLNMDSNHIGIQRTGVSKDGLTMDGIERNIPTSVNGAFADGTGNIAISALSPSDVDSMLLPYALKSSVLPVSTDTTFSNASDDSVSSSLAVKEYVNNHGVGTDTTSLSNRINLKKDNSDSTGATGYVTPTQLNQKGANWFNILKYGASPSKTSSQNTIAINSAIAAALAVKGTVYIPAGTYLVDSIVWNPYVAITGDGSGSVLKSNSAVTMLSYVNGAVNVIAHNNTLSNFVLDGNNIGTVGIYTNFMSEFTFNNVYCINFTQWGAHLYRTLIGSINNCSFLTSANGLYLEGTSSMQANLITLNTCRMSMLTGVGLKIFRGSGIIINSADFESCGTKGDSTTGAISVSQMTGSMAMVVNRGWFEANSGTQINIGAPFAVTSYSFNETPITMGDSAQYGLLVANGAKVYVKNSMISGAIKKDVQATHFDTRVVLTNTTVGTINALDNALILQENSSNRALNDSISGGVWMNVTNRSLNGTAEARILVNNSASGGSMYKPSVNAATYRNIHANDLAIYNGGGNMSFLQDNGGGNINFAVTAFNALTLTGNSIIFGGAPTYPFLSASASLNITNIHSTVNFTASGTSDTLPSAVGIAGKPYTFKLSVAGTASLVPLSGQTIDGASSYKLYGQYSWVTIQSNGANWIIIGYGSNLSGTATLASGTVTVSTPLVKTGARIFVSYETFSGTTGQLEAKTSDIINGTSFIINSSSAADNSTVNWQIINP